MSALESLVANDTSQVLSETRARTDALIDSLPPGRIDAKRMIEGQLEIVLCAEELQALVAIAGDEASTGVFRELPRAVFAVRALAIQQLAKIESGHFDRQELLSTARAISSALDERGRLEDVLGEMLGSSVEPELSACKRLGEVCGVLLPERQPLVAALVLIPRLVALAEVAKVGDPRVVAPSLDELEVAMLRNETDYPRVLLDAGVLRTIIESDLQQWFRLATQDGDETVLCERREVFKQLTRTRLTHEVITGQLQSAQDAALKANDDTLATAIRNSRGRLFAKYLKTVPIIRRGQSAIHDPVVEDIPDNDVMPELIRESSEIDSESDRLARDHVSAEEIYLQALKQSKPERQETPVFSGTVELRRSRQRLRRLLMAAVSMSVVVVLVYVWSFQSRETPNRIAVTSREFTQFLPVTSVSAIGTMLYARIDSWEHFPIEDRVARAQGVGDVAEAKGFEVVYFVDTVGEPLARWTRTDGMKLEE